MSVSSRLSWLPNAVSVLRMLLVVPVVAVILADRPVLALGLVLVAAASDALDGFLAKRCGWKSALGTLLDPAADKLLLSGAFVALTIAGRVPPWLLGVVLLRDAVISVGAYAYRRIMGRLTVRPSRVSKLNTLVQFVFVVFLLLEPRWLHPSSWWSGFAVGAVAVAALLSGTDYVWTYGLPALAVLRERGGTSGT